jgi:predicted PhzF superfamily epimerase YddE/YHI9
VTQIVHREFALVDVFTAEPFSGNPAGAAGWFAFW